MENNSIKIGITQGDPNGVGLDIILRIFADAHIYKYCTPVLYASPKAFSYYKKQLNLQEPVYQLVRTAADAKPGKFNLVISSEEGMEVKMGEASAEAGKQALLALDKALEDARAGHIEAIVTAPLDKSTVAVHSPGFSGHTGYIAEKLGSTDYAMMLLCEDLRVALVTEHVPITRLGEKLTQQAIENKIQTVHSSLVEDFGITRPRVAVLGLNPHAGDSGLLGSEENTLIKPAIEKVFARQKLVYGPYPADSFFGSGQHRQFDAVIAMYHDQGLIPFKTFAFYDGVNFTAGLPVVRTSPDHGTAYDLAGKGTAETLSFRNAIYEAIHIVRTRKQYATDHENPLPFSELRRERFRIDF
ncbi:MAG: 4-hydroxythreonine-4-phosphate dehydrogenase PdxA [Bacteroidetes bacterium]|nr:4-hydroxythreonine-4-phosphate dehydrogenase PdxA [Bacteroidota bacterium]